MGTKRKQNAEDEKSTSKASDKRQKKVHQNGHGASPPVNGTAAPAKNKKGRYSEADAELAKLLESLSSEDAEIRLEAAKDLLLFVDPKTKKDAALVEKVLRRLTKGLGSNRKAARVGFSLVLAEIVSQLYGSKVPPQVEVSWDLDGFIEFVVAQTSPTGEGENKEEKQSLYLGQAFGLKAILQSSAVISPEQWSTILCHAFKIAKTTPTLRENVGLMLCDAAKSLDKVKSPKTYLKELMEGVTTNDLLKTPEGVAIWIVYRTKFGESELPADVWHENDPLCTKERHTLAQVMRENFKDATEKPAGNGAGKKSQSGYARAAPSFAWDIVLMSALKTMDEVEFKKFWKQIVDQNMFTNTSTPKRKSCGLQIFMNMLRTAPAMSLKAIFSPNLMRCIVNQCQEPDRTLHAAAKSALKEVSSRVNREPTSARIIVQELLSNNGSLDFDRVTKSKTIEICLKHADHETLAETVKLLESIMITPAGEDGQEAETRRHIVSDMLLNMIRQRMKSDFEDVEPKGSWYIDTLQALAKYAYFQPNKTTEKRGPSPPLTDSDRSLLKDRILSCLTHLISQGVNNVGSVAFQLISFISRYEEDETQELLLQASEDITNSLKKAQKMLKKIDKDGRKAKKGTSSTSLNALKLLGSMSVLQVYNGDPDAVSILDELKQCYESITESSSAASDGFDVLFELILSFAARPSALSRSLSEQVFSAFAADLTSNSLTSMTAVLDTPETVAGQKELYQQDDEDVDMGSGSGSDDASEAGEEASDVEMLSEDNSSDSALSSSASDADDDEAAEFNRKFALALGTAPFNPTSQPRGSRSTSPTSTTSTLSSAAMHATDAALSSIFAQQRAAAPAKPARQRRDARAAVLGFKNRVLDLLLIYVRACKGSVLALGLVQPLLRVVQGSSSPQVSGKAFALLKTYVDAAKNPANRPAVSVDEAMAGLRGVHEGIRRPGNGGARWVKACSLASLFFCRLVVAHGGRRESVGRVYLKSMIEGRPRVAASFYHEFDNWMLSLEVE